MCVFVSSHHLLNICDLSEPRGKGSFAHIRSVLVKFFHGVDNLAEATGVIPVMLIGVSIRVGLVCI